MLNQTVAPAEAVGDRDLVAAAKRGDREGFASLYRRYRGPVFRLIYSRVRDVELAEDLTSRTFLQGWRAISSVQVHGEHGDLVAWFLTIARNLIYENAKTTRRRWYYTAAASGAAGHAYVTEVRMAASPGGSPVEAEVLAGETAVEVRRWVAQLPAAERECVQLRFLDGLSVAETATAIGRTNRAISALTLRAKRRLAQVAYDETRGGLR